MEKYSKFMAIILGIIFISSCKNGHSSGLMSNATGRPGDVLLVMSNEDYNSAAGVAISEVLQESAPSLPQDEPMFQVSYVTPKGLKGNLKTVRNIIIIDVDSTRFTQSSFSYSYDEWANGQMLIHITSPSTRKLADYIIKNRSAILNMILNHEYYISGEYLSHHYSAIANQYVDSLFHHYINVPEDIKKHKFGKNFLWMSNDAIRKRLDFMVYTINYTSDKDISLDNIVSVRDSVLKSNIQGENVGSYPTTEKKVGLLYRTIFLPNSPKRAEVRGLWKMEGPDMMGGPFVCQAFIDKNAKKVYFVDTFVYNPNDKKRDLMRVMEASLYSFRPDSIIKFNPSIILEAKYSKYY